MLTLNGYRINYFLHYATKNDSINESLFIIIPTLLNNLLTYIIFNNLTITKKEYQKINFTLEQYIQLYTKYKNNNFNIIEYINKSPFLNNFFNEQSIYGTINIQNIEEPLEILKNKLLIFQSKIE